MFQLAQTDNGQITGVCSTISVDAQGKLNPSQNSMTGVIDNDQVTLTVHQCIWLGSSFGGTVRGDSGVHLQVVESNGTVQSKSFQARFTIRLQEIC